MAANPDGNDDAMSVVIDSSKKYQSVFGFGGAFTDAAGINIQSLPEQLQEAVLKSYYSDEGTIKSIDLYSLPQHKIISR